MTTKEVAKVCGVTEECVRQNSKVIGVELGDRWHPHDWTEEEVKKIQVQLMVNAQNNNVNASDVVKTSSKTVLGEGLAATIISNSGDVDAMKEYCDMLMQRTLAQHELLLAQRQNQLLLEQKEAAEAETERIYQCNRNFHNNLYTATDLAKMLGTNPNKIGRIANEHNLKQDPIYGKLGKVQLNNGRWVEIFYYNDDAKFIIENNL